MLFLSAVTIFLSSGLLFLVQPMFAKMILPLLGGAPSVWTVCMVFYQLLLLAGYGAAHLSSTRLKLRSQIILQLILLSASFLFLPVGIAQGAFSILKTHPIAWLLACLFLSLGLPFFAISSNGILLQKWFSRTRHPSANDPYFLSQAGNAGSILALLSYPFLLEPRFRLFEQSRLWSGLFAVLVFLTAVCTWKLYSNRNGEENTLPDDLERPGESVVTPGRRLKWILLAFVPSSLMLGVTNYITCDISPFPLLWVVPLVVYLLSFVIVFSRKPLVPHEGAVRAEAILILPLVLLMITESTRPVWLVISFHLLAFFAVALACHGEVARDRPEPRHLTQFYLWISVGGFLGGVFNGIIGPTVFNGFYEYPATLILAAMLIPDRGPLFERGRALWLDIGLPVLLGFMALALLWVARAGHWVPAGASLKPLLAVPAVLCFLFSRRSLRFGLGIGALMVAGSVYSLETGRPLHVERSFFGQHKVVMDPGENYHWLVHGVTVHGGQSLDPQREREPLAYYHPTGPIGQIFSIFPDAKTGGNIAVVGLGTGSMAAYGRPGWLWTFYEIDPAVKRIAENGGYFTFLKNSRAQYEIVLGDARISLKDAPNGQYRLIVLDAFGSDAIPIHLLTREALNLYRSKLAGGGVIAFHITNRYLELYRVIGNLAADAGMAAWDQEDVYEGPSNGKFTSRWVVLSENSSVNGALAGDVRWKALKGDSGESVWSDDFSNVAGVLSLD